MTDKIGIHTEEKELSFFEDRHNPRNMRIHINTEGFYVASFLSKNWISKLNGISKYQWYFTTVSGDIAFGVNYIHEIYHKLDRLNEKEEQIFNVKINKWEEDQCDIKAKPLYKIKKFLGVIKNERTHMWLG